MKYSNSAKWFIYKHAFWNEEIIRRRHTQICNANQIDFYYQTIVQYAHKFMNKICMEIWYDLHTRRIINITKVIIFHISFIYIIFLKTNYNYLLKYCFHFLTRSHIFRYSFEMNNDKRNYPFLFRIPLRSQWNVYHFLTVVCTVKSKMFLLTENETYLILQ